MAAPADCGVRVVSAMAYSRVYELQRGFAVRFTLNDGALEVEWLPTLPQAKIGRKLLPRYRSARNHFLESLGIPMLVVEL